MPTFASSKCKATIDDDAFCPGLDYKKRFEKDMVGEVDVFGGGYFGNYVLSSWSAGGRLFMHFNHMFSFGGEYMYTNLDVDPPSSFGQIKKTNNQQIVDGQLAISWPILFGFGHNQFPMDLYLTVGAGTINLNQAWDWLALVGGGLKIYLDPEWIVLRVDVNTYLHNTPLVSGNKMATNLAILLGLGFYFPYKPVH